MGLLHLLSRALSPERDLERVEREIDLARERAGKDPGNAEVWKTLGDLHLRIGLVGSASESYQHSVDLFLKRAEQHHAIEILRKLVLFNFFDLPKFERIFFEQGLRQQVIGLYLEAACRMRDSDESYARDIFRRVLSIDPLNQEASKALGVRQASGPAHGALRVLFTIPQTRLLMHEPEGQCIEEIGLLNDEQPSVTIGPHPQELAQEQIAAFVSGDVDQLIRESMEQQREMLEFMEGLLRKAKDAVERARGSERGS